MQIFQTVPSTSNVVCFRNFLAHRNHVFFIDSLAHWAPGWAPLQAKKRMAEAKRSSTASTGLTGRVSPSPLTLPPPTKEIVKARRSIKGRCLRISMALEVSNHRWTNQLSKKMVNHHYPLGSPDPPRVVKNVTYIITFLYPPLKYRGLGGGGKKCNMGIVGGYTCYVTFSNPPPMNSHGNTFGGGTLGGRNCNIFPWGTQTIYVTFLGPPPITPL